jgi:hypothetical protein
MGDDPPKKPADDRTVEVGGDALSRLRAAAERRAQQARAPESEHQMTSPLLRSLRPSQPEPGHSQNVREVLEEARRLGSASDQSDGETKAIKRDNLVKLLKSEVKEANAAAEAPGVGILRHTRPKGETPQHVLALGRARSATPQAVDSPHRRLGERPTQTSDLEALSRALEELEDDNESTRQVTVIPELRASLPRRELCSGQDAALAADDASSRAPKAMPRDLPRDHDAPGAADEASGRTLKAMAQQSFDEDDNATREVASLRELLRQAQDTGVDEDGNATREVASLRELLRQTQDTGSYAELEQSPTASQLDDSQDYSLEEFVPEHNSLEESAGSMHIGIKVSSAHTGQAPDVAELPIHPPASQEVDAPLATPAPVPAVTPAPQPAITQHRVEPTPTPVAPSHEIRPTPPPSAKRTKSLLRLVLALVLALLVLAAVAVLATQGG